MNMNQYIPLALRTEGVPSPLWRLSHAIIGLCTEAGELLNSGSELNTKEEIGDLFWYLALGANVLGVADYSTPKFRDGTTQMIKISIVIVATEALDKIKKITYYHQPLDSHRAAILADLNEIHNLVHALCRVANLDPAIVMHANIAKLRARYPWKFTTELAANRDLEAEEVALQG